MAVDRIRVEGLTELIRELRVAVGALPGEMRAASRRSVDKVVEGTRSAFASMPGSAPKVAPTVKALAHQGGAQVKVGGTGTSVGELVAMGNTFGSERHPQFPPPIKGGYALFPTIEAMEEQIVDEHGNAVDRVLRKAFPKH